MSKSQRGDDSQGSLLVDRADVEARARFGGRRRLDMQSRKEELGHPEVAWWEISNASSYSNTRLVSVLFLGLDWFRSFGFATILLVCEIDLYSLHLGWFIQLPNKDKVQFPCWPLSSIQRKRSTPSCSFYGILCESLPGMGHRSCD